MKFSEMGLSKQLLDSLDAMGFKDATPIQEEAIPILLKGEDLVGQAQTGTGKTAAFGLPILEAWLKSPHPRTSSHGQLNAPKIHVDTHPTAHIRPTHPTSHSNPTHPAGNSAQHGAQNAQRGRPTSLPSALILVPTRELAVQVNLSLQKMAGKTGAKTVPIYGGADMFRQKKALSSQVDIVVGTPGRTLDHLKQGTLRLSGIKTVVLDEADRMLDMGFIRDVVKILDQTPKERQTLLFSATMPSEIANIAHRYMRNPKTIKVSEDQLTVEGIKQFYARVYGNQRLGVLVGAIRAEKPSLAIVFCRMKHESKKLAKQLRANGISADAMHGNLSQNARENALRRFRAKEFQVLVATDLASRGIDVQGITHVFNYDIPNDPMTYVHRIGRTARAGASGTAISLVVGEPRRALRQIEYETGSKISELPITPATDLAVPQTEEMHGGRHVNGHSRHGGGHNHGNGRNGGPNWGGSDGGNHGGDGRNHRSGRFKGRPFAHRDSAGNFHGGSSFSRNENSGNDAHSSRRQDVSNLHNERPSFGRSDVGKQHAHPHQEHSQSHPGHSGNSLRHGAPSKFGASKPHSTRTGSSLRGKWHKNNQL